MNARNWSIFGLVLLLAFTLIVGLPGSSQAQQNDPATGYGPAVQDNASGYYGYNGGGYVYCPMGPGYRYSAPVNPNYQDSSSNSWERGYQGAWCPWNSGYSRGYRSGCGHCW